MYEMARRAALDRRSRISEALSTTLRSHGVAGIFIDPERVLVSTPTAQARINPRRDTALFHSHLSDDAFETIAQSLAEGVGVSTTARIQKVDKKTVLLVLAKAAGQTEKVQNNLLRNLSVSECQLDEMWSFIGKKEKNLDALEKLQGVLGDAWIWTAFDAVNKVFVAHKIGKRTLPVAIALVNEVKRVTSHIPSLFTSDQLAHYANALLQVYGKKIYPPRQSGVGRLPKPRVVPPEELLYAHVVKKYKQNQIVSVMRKIIYGAPEKVDEILRKSMVSQKINTFAVERSNGTIRHMDARCNRRTLRFSKLKVNHERQLRLSLAYYHLCCRHRTLTNRYGKPTTPFMAAGITDHVWSMGELLRFSDEIPNI
jgi:IS1 family transposase